MSTHIKTEQDLWIEMSIRETWTQSHFAQIAYDNIERKSEHPTDTAFSSIHSFLSHCAMVSKMLNIEIAPGKSIGAIIDVPSSSIVHRRKFRNHLEHYDERLKMWISHFAQGAIIGTYNIGPKSAFSIPNMIFVSHYDPTTKTFTFVDEDFRLDMLATEVAFIKAKADNWVQSVQSGRITPPFAGYIN